MSSRLLLVLARHMDADGAFKKAGRRGNYTTDELMKAATANELMALRYNQIGGDEPIFFRSQAQIEAEAEDFEADEEDADEAREELGLTDLF